MGEVNGAIEELRLDLRAVELDEGQGLRRLPRGRAGRGRGAARARGALSDELTEEVDALRTDDARYTVLLADVNGETKEQKISEIVRAYQPNGMGFWRQARAYLGRWWEFLTDEPREANTEGGVLPAIFGTVAMILVMSIAVAPLGVIAALYLREYAKQGVRSERGAHRGQQPRRRAVDRLRRVRSRLLLLRGRRRHRRDLLPRAPALARPSAPAG